MLCKNCILDDGLYGDVVLDSTGVCNYCRAYETIRKSINNQPRQEAQLKKRLVRARKTRIKTDAPYDCLVPLSGGKDSSYLLWKLTQVTDLQLLAVTGTSPFQEPRALENARALTQKLGVDHEIVPVWEAPELEFVRRLFAETGSVCFACLGAFARVFAIAQDRRIPAIVIGDSRDQMLEGDPTLTAYGLRHGPGDNTLAYGKKDYWWLKHFSPIFAGLGHMVRHILPEGSEARARCLEVYGRVETRAVPDVIPFYFFMGHHEKEMVQALEWIGWTNLDEGLLGHPDCRFQPFARDPVEHARAYGVYVREQTLGRDEAIQELIADIERTLDRNDASLVEEILHTLGLQVDAIQDRTWWRTGRKERRARGRIYLELLRRERA